MERMTDYPQEASSSSGTQSQWPQQSVATAYQGWPNTANGGWAATSWDDWSQATVQEVNEEGKIGACRSVVLPFADDTTVIQYWEEIRSADPKHQPTKEEERKEKLDDLKVALRKPSG